MEEEQPKQPNKYIEYIKTHKYTVAFVGAIALIFILIIGMIVLITQQQPTKKAPAGSGGNSQNVSGVPSGSLPSSSIAPVLIITTPNPTEAATIDTQTQPQITPNVGVPYTVTDIKKYGDAWAIMTINNPDIGNAKVITERVNNSWKVVLGPGTNFTQDDLQSVGAPSELLNIAQPAANIPPSPTPVPGDIQ